MNCITCHDTGLFMFRKPMVVGLGVIQWTNVPQICTRCEAGDALAQKYEDNLKHGRAGMHGIADQQNVAAEEKR